MLSRNLIGRTRSQFIGAPKGRWKSITTAPNFDNITASLPKRKLAILYDDLTPRNTHNLSASLASFVPSSWLPETATKNGLPPNNSANSVLPPAFHLVYFNPALPSSVLLPDGTDPNQSPGLPFVRRMWAGGYVKFHPQKEVNVDGGRWCCVEGIRDVTVKGKAGEEKIFVGIERRIGKFESDKQADEGIRERLWKEDEGDFGESVVIERRNIVFMKERSVEELKAVKLKGAGVPKEKMLLPPHPPQFTHTLTPDATLLFRYSALTFNAHAIHLDPSYCINVEGHRNLLVHGPLSFSLLTLMLKDHVTKKHPGSFIESIEYRNLAPLYAGEPLKLCGRESEKGDGRYDIWAETPEGGIAVKGVGRIGKR